MAIGPNIDESLAILNEEQVLPKVKSKRPTTPPVANAGALYEGRRRRVRADNAQADTTSPSIEPRLSKKDRRRLATATEDKGWTKPEAPLTENQKVEASEETAQPYEYDTDLTRKDIREMNRASARNQRDAGDLPEQGTTAGPAEKQVAQRVKDLQAQSATTRGDLRRRQRAEKGTLRRAIRGATVEDEDTIREAAEALEGTRGEIAALKERQREGRRILRGRGNLASLQPEAGAETTAEAEAEADPKSLKELAQAAAKIAYEAHNKEKTPPPPQPAESDLTDEQAEGMAGMDVDEELAFEGLESLPDAVIPGEEAEIPLEKSYADEYDAEEPQTLYEPQDASPLAYRESERANDLHQLSYAVENTPYNYKRGDANPVVDQLTRALGGDASANNAAMLAVMANVRRPEGVPPYDHLSNMMLAYDLYLKRGGGVARIDERMHDPQSDRLRADESDLMDPVLFSQLMNQLAAQ